MAIFNSYVKLPEGIWFLNCDLAATLCWLIWLKHGWTLIRLTSDEFRNGEDTAKFGKTVWKMVITGHSAEQTQRYELSQFLASFFAFQHLRSGCQWAEGQTEVRDKKGGGEYLLAMSISERSIPQLGSVDHPPDEDNLDVVYPHTYCWI